MSATADFYSTLINNAPSNLIQLGDDNHLQNMANFSTMVNSAMPVTTPAVDPTVGGNTASDTVTNDLQSFSDWTGTNGNTKAMAKDLLDRGLKGASQIYFDNPNTNSRDSILHSQADWMPSLIQQILSNARKNNYRSASEIMAHKDQLIGNPDYLKAVNNPAFGINNPNFWSVITDSLLPEQWAKYDDKHSVKNQTAKN